MRFKKFIPIILLIIFLICAVSVVSADDDSEVDMLTLSKGGIVIHYPSTWGYSESTSNYSIMAISKLDSIDSAGIGQININVEKKPIDEEFYTYVNETYKSMEKDSSFEMVSSGGVLVKNIDAVEYVYISNEDGVEKEHKAVWFEKGGQAYVLLYSAPPEDFENDLYIFDYILSDIQIT